MAAPRTTDSDLPLYTETAVQVSNPSSIIRIPISAFELDERDQDHPHVVNPLTPPSNKKAWYCKLAVNTPDPDIRFISMTRAEYAAYWAKEAAHTSGREAAYLPHVSEPPGGRKAWVQRRLLEQESQ